MYLLSPIVRTSAKASESTGGSMWFVHIKGESNRVYASNYVIFCTKKQKLFKGFRDYRGHDAKSGKLSLMTSQELLSVGAENRN